MAENEIAELVQRWVTAMPMAQTLELRFAEVRVGVVVLEMPILPQFCFRPGQLQATAVFSIADFAAAAAAATTLPLGWTNATIDATLKLVAPAVGARLRSHGRVIHSSRLLTLCAADVFAVDEQEQEKLCATLLGTTRNIELK